MRRKVFVPACFLVLGVWVASGQAQSTLNIYRALLDESGPTTPQVTTEELRKILADKSATVFDTRPFKEFAISHIPGAVVVAPKPGVSKAVYVSDIAEIGRAVREEKAAPIVLYCDGPYCGKSKRVAEELLAAGYRNVRRYQLGIPVWRALGGVTQIELEGMRYVVELDRTAFLIDAREADEFRAGSLQRAHNIPFSEVQPGKDRGEVGKAKDDGRLPVDDRNTRVVVFGRDGKQAAALAQALTAEAFHNTAYFDGTFEALRVGVKQ
jgi:rhodanese-related sulfurtransferase